MLEFLKECYHPDCGGFGPFPQHDPHLLFTLSAVQIATMYDATDVLDIPLIISYVKNLQQEDGSFAGDKWGEIDTRFSFCAAAILSLLGHLDAINVEKVWVISFYEILELLNFFERAFNTLNINFNAIF